MAELGLFGGDSSMAQLGLFGWDSSIQLVVLCPGPAALGSLLANASRNPDLEMSQEFMEGEFIFQQ